MVVGPIENVVAKEEDPVSPNNLCIINRLPDKDSEIIGIYITCASRRTLLGNKQIHWSENFLEKPLKNGEYALLAVELVNYVCFDIRIDIKNGEKNEQYFHRNALFAFPEGEILHKAIISANDGSAAWKVSKNLDKSFGK